MAKFDINTKQRMPSGYDIPVLGYGIYQTPPQITKDVTLHAFKTGYRHVDSARMYRNEGGAGAAVKKSGVPREDIFFTTKVYTRDMGYLIHAPYGGRDARLGSWRALVEAQKAGEIRSLGVSNYGIHHLEELQAYISQQESQHGKGAGGVISVGQWEIHPWLMRTDIVEWCQKRGIVIEAYSPIVQGTRWGEKSLQKLQEKKGKTGAQILLRWSLQKGLVPLPKSVTPARIEENAKLYDLELTDNEIKSLDTKEYAPVCWDPVKSDD
ncbi:hypothetical protein MMC14_003031 [Varicellaria rhodocarpa]|nr:hypothetical protein [Varicellaria rhodocarpa]